MSVNRAMIPVSVILVVPVEIDFELPTQSVINGLDACDISTIKDEEVDKISAAIAGSAEYQDAVNTAKAAARSFIENTPFARAYTSLFFGVAEHEEVLP